MIVGNQGRSKKDIDIKKKGEWKWNLRQSKNDEIKVKLASFDFVADWTEFNKRIDVFDDFFKEAGYNSKVGVTRHPHLPTLPFSIIF